MGCPQGGLWRGLSCLWRSGLGVLGPSLSPSSSDRHGVWANLLPLRCCRQRCKCPHASCQTSLASRVLGPAQKAWTLTQASPQIGAWTKKKKTSFTRNGLDPSKGPLRTSCVRTEEVSSQCRNLRG